MKYYNCFLDSVSTHEHENSIISVGFIRLFIMIVNWEFGCWSAQFICFQQSLALWLAN